jgi:hypothetical protein
MPVFDRSAFRPRKHKNDPGRAPRHAGTYDGAPIPTTLPKALRNKPPSQQPQKGMQGTPLMQGTTPPAR